LPPTLTRDRDKEHVAHLLVFRISEGTFILIFKLFGLISGFNYLL